MQIAKPLAVATFILLTGCAELSPEDRATLNDTRNMAMQARDQATRAAQDAAMARDSAAKSAAAAEKANRMFMQSQKK